MLISEGQYNDARFKVQMRARILRGIAHTFSSITDELKVEVGPLGFSMKAVDPAHICMMQMELRSKTMFESFKVFKEGNIGFNLDYLCEIVVGLKDNDLINIETIDGTTEKPLKPRLVFTFNDVREVQPSVDTTGMSDAKIPSLKLPVEFIMPYNKAQDIVHNIGNKISDHIRITAWNDGVEFKVEGDERYRIIKMPKDLLEDLTFNPDAVQEWKNNPETVVDAEVCSLFPEDYFKIPFFKRGAKGWRHFFGKGKELNLIRLQIGHNYPMKVIAGDSDSIEIIYLLAPRIESE